LIGSQIVSGVAATDLALLRRDRSSGLFTSKRPFRSTLAVRRLAEECLRAAIPQGNR
jgi:3-methyladenine DNA glycosylase AlkC